MNEDKGARVANQTEWRIQIDGRTAKRGERLNGAVKSETKRRIHTEQDEQQQQAQQTSKRHSKAMNTGTDRRH